MTSTGVSLCNAPRPNGPGFRSLAARILVGATAAVGLALVIAASYFSLEERAALDRVFDKQGQSLTDSLSVFVIEQLVSLDYPALEHAIRITARKNDSIEYIEVTHQGRIATRFGNPAANGRSYVAEVARRDGDSRGIGQVRILFSTREHDALLASNLRDHLLTMLLIFAVLGLSLGWLLRRIVIRPIGALTRRTEQAIIDALPELELVSAAGEPLDEIRQLDRRFNQLLDGLKQRDAARDKAEASLVEYQNNLERVVGERTHELQLSQAEALRLNRAKSEFLAAASHDLRQPLQAINLFHDALKRTPLNDEQQRVSHYLSLSLASLGDLLNALLDISKLDAGRVRPVPEVIAIDQLLARIDAEFSGLASEKGLRFKLWFPFRELAVRTDAKLLLSLLSNLVGNAIKYTARGGILLGVRVRGERLQFQVWDTGIGISPQDQRHIFDEYFQAHNAERDRSKGLGLGLSIVKRLARLLGTEVRCDSRLGKGSVFAFSLPLAERPAAEPWPLIGDGSEADAGRELAGQRIMVVEDDAILAKALEVAFVARGMMVASYHSAEEALADGKTAVFDYCVSDFRLPQMDGLQFLSKLRQRAGKPIKALILTGDTSPERIKEAESSGWPVLFKPVDFPRLLGALDGLDSDCGIGGKMVGQAVGQAVGNAARCPSSVSA